MRRSRLTARVARLEGQRQGNAGRWLHLPHPLAPRELEAAVAAHRARHGWRGQVAVTIGAEPAPDLTAWRLRYGPAAGEG